MKTNFFKSFIPALTLILTMTISLAFTSENEVNDVLIEADYFNGSTCVDIPNLQDCTIGADYDCTHEIYGQLYVNGTSCTDKLTRSTP